MLNRKCNKCGKIYGTFRSIACHLGKAHGVTMSTLQPDAARQFFTQTSEPMTPQPWHESTNKTKPKYLGGEGGGKYWKKVASQRKKDRQDDIYPARREKKTKKEKAGLGIKARKRAELETVLLAIPIVLEIPIVLGQVKVTQP
jgi:hypothetical protein